MAKKPDLAGMLEQVKRRLDALYAAMEADKDVYERKCEMLDDLDTLFAALHTAHKKGAVPVLLSKDVIVVLREWLHVPQGDQSAMDRVSDGVCRLLARDLGDLLKEKTDDRET